MPVPQSNNQESSKQILTDKDVLGLEKPGTETTSAKSYPKRIFIVLGILVIIAVLYWLITGK